MFMKYCLKCLNYAGRDCNNINWCSEYPEECRYIKVCERFRQDFEEPFLVFKGEKGEPSPMSEKELEEIRKWNRKIDDKKKKIKMKITKEQIIQVQDWDLTVKEIYGKPYTFQQQDGCKSRGIVRITIPDEAEDYKQDAVPEIVNHEKMGVSFSAWLERDPKKPLENDKDDYSLSLWWDRNFYPNVQMIANDLCEKGIIEKGNYIIEIDW